MKPAQQGNVSLGQVLDRRPLRRKRALEERQITHHRWLASVRLHLSVSGRGDRCAEGDRHRVLDAARWSSRGASSEQPLTCESGPKGIRTPDLLAASQNRRKRCADLRKRRSRASGIGEVMGVDSVACRDRKGRRRRPASGTDCRSSVTSCTQEVTSRWLLRVPRFNHARDDHAFCVRAPLAAHSRTSVSRMRPCIWLSPMDSSGRRSLARFLHRSRLRRVRLPSWFSNRWLRSPRLRSASERYVLQATCPVEGTSSRP